MLLSFVLPIIEKSLNRFLSLDPETAQRLATMTGKTVAIELTQSKLSFYFVVENSCVRLFDRCPEMADVTLQGTPFDFLRLGTVQNSGAAIFSGNVTVLGDPEVAQQFKRVFAELEIDWEEHLSRVTGDVIAYQIGNCVREFSQWAKQTRQTLQENLTEYLQEEVRWLPTRLELQDFYTDVDSARDAVERLALRIERLKSRA